MREELERTGMLVGEAGLARLARARVAVFGVGGVGGYVVEALARSGVGTLDLIDPDRVALSNINRQIIALHSTVGQYKVDAARARVLDINPEAVVHCHRTFFLPETADQFCFSDCDYVVDAIDTVAGKLEIIVQADRAGTPVISSMGAGNKLDACAFEVADIYETSVCPLARVMRRELKKRGIAQLKVVYSKEKALTPLAVHEDSGGGDFAAESSAGGQKRQNPQMADKRRQTPGSIAFVPSVAGLILAGEVIKFLTFTGNGSIMGEIHHNNE